MITYRIKKAALLVIALISIPLSQYSLYGQETLRLDEAISIALEENYGIKIVLLEQKAEEMQVYKSNAGFGPTIDWNTNLGLTGTNVNQVFLDGRIVSRYGRAINPNTGLSLRLALFDGGRMEATYERLGQLGELSELQGKVVIQNTIINVMATYYDINRQKERVTFLESIIANYEERLAITEQRWKVGRGSKLDYLQSKTDLNAQLSALTTARNSWKNAKVSLNGLLNRDPSMDFDTAPAVESKRDYELEEMLQLANSRNRDILLLQKAMDISMTREREAEAALKPQVGLDSRLGFTYSNTNAGFLKSNRSIAASVGLGAVWNIYDGNHNKNQIAIAKVNTEIIANQQEQLQAQIANDLSIAYNQYNSDKELLTFEILNKEIAEENLTISLDKFRLGGSTILELNEAQRAYDISLNRLVDAQYNIQVSELELLRLSGQLVE